MRRRRLGELRWLATVCRPVICARLAKLASRINSLCGSDLYRTNDLVRAVREWWQATASKYTLPPHPWKALDFTGEATRDVRSRGERMHCGERSIVGWSDASHGDQSPGGQCRLWVIGLISSPLTGQRHILQWTSKFTKKMVEEGLGGEVYAFSEMVDLAPSYWIFMDRTRV